MAQALDSKDENNMHIAEYGKYKIISFTDRGKELSNALVTRLGGAARCGQQGDGASSGNTGSAANGEQQADNCAESLDGFVRKFFVSGNVLIFIGATAIAVRAIAPRMGGSFSRMASRVCSTAASLPFWKMSFAAWTAS